MRTRLLGAVSAIALAAAMVPLAAVFAGPAGADTYNVTTTANDGDGSLRAAIAAAEGRDGPDEIDIQAGLGTITITSEISWSEGGPLTIHGNGNTLTGPGVARGLVDNAGEDLTIDGLTITGFGGSTENDAAPIVQEGGGLTLSDCTITGNSIASSDDDVAGAVLTEGGESSITNCTMTGNTATTSDGDAAGAFLTEGGSTTIESSTINCNAATNTTEGGGDAAGGVLSEGGDTLVNNTSIQGNTATGNGDLEQQILAEEGFDGNGNTISDDTGVCTAPPAPPVPPAPPAPPAAEPLATAPRFTG